MADVARIPRRRGGLCGLLLILLGAWGGLVPFIGPYFKFAFTPDKAWAYTSGRLYLSALPGAVALVSGLIIMATRSRTAGVLSGLLATVAGAWFIVGAAITDTVLGHTSINPGLPVVHAGANGGPSPIWVFLEQLGFFVGVGALIIFFAAIAIGRFSLLSARDAAAFDQELDEFPSSTDPSLASPATATTSGYPATTTGQYPASNQYPATSSPGTSSPASPFPASPRPFPGDEPTQTQDRFPSTSTGSTGQFPASTGQFPTSSPSGQFPESNPPRTNG
jgi:hypothetical protein